jgi:hypothetical protein
MGLFVYPGDFTPSGRVVKVKGMPFRIPSLEDNRKNAIEPRGQKLNVPAGSYSGVAFMGFGHSGKHPGTWTFHYADGSSEKIESQIPEWCTPAPEGFDVAFTAPHRYIPGGPAHPACEWFTWELKTQEGKHLTAITLPEMKNAYLFAVTVVEK